ncbi:enoyl-CoA hydratase [Zoogloea sp.]|uniref:enoyl-CoA hydratase n=1 Tax=Zoogloea sp. TaxID=49181 RepID=UPI0026035AA1|nr:enoyl-CoA hydratase [Zoogloea sp.]MDD3353666.1 enoyl-CoA hydratase [Zoogloea sp.]
MNAVVDTPQDAMLLRQDVEGVTTLTLNRPAQFNALSMPMLETLLAELQAVAADPSVRVVVLAGAGKAFCAGHDLKEMRGNYSKGFQQALFRLCGKVMMQIVAMPQPVIARIHGIATAAGCQLVSMCDLAVASDVARFAVSGINAGLFCSTPAVGLSRNMGRKQAFEMLVTGDFIDAAEAQRRGLVNRVVPLDSLDEEVGKLAASICAKSPKAIAMGKQMFYSQLEMGLDAAYQHAAEVMACNAMCEDAAEGMDAFMQKRKPVWTGR